jgi:Cyanobacterial TRADD-N associated 2-Transmembrane domain
MPRDRVVLTREPDRLPEPSSEQQAEFNRAFRRGFVIIGVGAAFDLAGAVLIAFGQLPAGIAVVAVGLVIGLLAAREFTRAGRTVDERRRRGY